MSTCGGSGLVCDWHSTKAWDGSASRREAGPGRRRMRFFPSLCPAGAVEEPSPGRS
jgi:hypothetical protein